MTTNERCVFCKIVNGLDEKTEILLSNDLCVIFRDIKPATPHHYLVVTKQHVTDAKKLKNNDISLVEGMVASGSEVVQNQGADPTDVRMGFHWPPFHAIGHLHLHVIADTDKMGWIASAIYKLNSYWFVSTDWLLDRLRNMEPGET